MIFSVTEYLLFVYNEVSTVTLLQKEVHDPSCIGMTSTAYILEIMCLLLFVFIPR